jgi:hypothetical protein
VRCLLLLVAAGILLCATEAAAQLHEPRDHGGCSEGQIQRRQATRFGCEEDVRSSTALPATCRTGQLYLDTDAAASSRYAICAATDTWATISETASTGAPVGAQYVVLALDASLTAERKVVSGSGLTMSDGGANGDLTLQTSSLEPEFLTPGVASCGAGARGKLAFGTGGSVLWWCDDQATPAIAYAALGNSSGRATSCLAAYDTDEVLSFGQIGASDFLRRGGVSGNELVGDAGGHGLMSTRHTDVVGDTPTLGEVIYAGAVHWVTLAGNNSTTRKFLRQTGDGAASAAPAWDTIAAGDYTALTGGAGILHSPTGTLATASTETSFLADAAAGSCGAGSKGQAAVTDAGGPLWYCDDSATPALRRAAYGDAAGDALQALSLAANGTNCVLGSAGGVDAAGNAEACTEWAPQGAGYVTIGNYGNLTAERDLAVEDGVTATDGGANASVTIGLAAITPDSVDAGTGTIHTGADTVTYLDACSRCRGFGTVLFAPALTAGHCDLTAPSSAASGSAVCDLTTAQQSMGAAATVREVVLYYSLGGTGAAIDETTLYVQDVTAGTFADVERHLTDITTGTSYSYTGLPRAMGAGEALAVSMVVLPGVSGTITLRGFKVVWDTD